MTLINHAPFSARQKMLYMFIAFCIVPLSGLSIDIYTPSLPDITHHFATTASAAKYTITAYMIGLGIFQPMVGPLSDSLGRRWIVTLGMAAVALTMFLATISPNIETLYIVRFFQGLAVAMSSVPARAMMNDIFEGIEFKKVMSTMTIIWAVGPLVAPYIGGYLQHLWGWRACFYTLSLYALVMLALLVIFIRETSSHHNPLHLGKILKSYTTIVSHRHFILGTLIQSMVYGILVVYGMLGSFLVQQGLHYNAIVFGRSALLVGVGWLLGTLTNRLLILVSEYKKALISTLAGLTIAIILIIFAITHTFNLYTLVIPTIGLAFCGSILFPMAFANCLTYFPQHAATANAVMIGLVMILTGIISGISGSFHFLNLWPISITFLIFWLVALMIFPVLFTRNT